MFNNILSRVRGRNSNDSSAKAGDDNLPRPVTEKSRWRRKDLTINPADVNVGGSSGLGGIGSSGSSIRSFPPPAISAPIPRSAPQPLTENQNLSNSPKQRTNESAQSQQHITTLKSQIDALKRESTHKDDELSAVEGENRLLREQLAKIYGRDPSTVFDDLSRAKLSLERMERELEGWKGLRMARKSSVRSNRSGSIGSTEGDGSRFV